MWLKQSPSMQTWIKILHWHIWKKVEKIVSYFLLFKYISNSTDNARGRYRKESRANINSGSTPTNDKRNPKKATTKRKAPICSVCEKTAHINSKRMICTHHNHLTHLHFTNKITDSFRQQKCEREGFFFCASIEVPFDKIRDELNTNVERDENYTREHLEKLDELNKHKYLSPKYQINVIYIRRVSIHDKPNKLWRYYTIRNVAEKWQIFNRIC